MRNYTRPFWITLGVYSFCTLILFVDGLARTGGQLSYPQDDTYIHMAIARHVVEDGFWGVTEMGFTSTTSSPLWTLLIVVTYWLGGVNVWMPLALNLVCGVLALARAYQILKSDASALSLSVLFTSAILFTLLPVLTLTGMEHVLHGWLTLWLIDGAAELLAAQETRLRRWLPVAVLGAVVTATRYEGLFVLMALGLFLVLTQRIRPALIVGGVGVLPITLYGLWSVHEGWYFFPNSILLKGNVPGGAGPDLATFLSAGLVKLLESPQLLLLGIACLTVFLWGTERQVTTPKGTYRLWLFLAVLGLHVQFADVGFRYEAYLILVGSVIAVDGLLALLRVYATQGRQAVTARSLAALLLGVSVILPLAWRTGIAFRDYANAVTNVYEHPYQLGLFVKRFYTGKTIAANDIGAINYLADVTVLDLYGLGSLDVLEAKRRGEWDTQAIAALVQRHGVEAVLIYNNWFVGQVPPEWIEVGRWQISNHVATGGDMVSFYAPSLAQRAPLITHLREFSSSLPSDVIQSGLYLTP